MPFLVMKGTSDEVVHYQPPTKESPSLPIHCFCDYTSGSNNQPLDVVLCTLNTAEFTFYRRNFSNKLGTEKLSLFCIRRHGVKIKALRLCRRNAGRSFGWASRKWNSTGLTPTPGRNCSATTDTRPMCAPQKSRPIRNLLQVAKGGAHP